MHFLTEPTVVEASPPLTTRAPTGPGDAEGSVPAPPTTSIGAPATTTSPPSDGPTTTGTLSGESLAGEFGCLACHSVDGSIVVGPSWDGLAGSERTFDDGSTAVADDAYLKESIVDPAARIVEGFTNVMPPNFADRMSTEEIDAVIAYIKTL